MMKTTDPQYRRNKRMFQIADMVHAIHQRLDASQWGMFEIAVTAEAQMLPSPEGLGICEFLRAMGSLSKDHPLKNPKNWHLIPGLGTGESNKLVSEALERCEPYIQRVATSSDAELRMRFK